MFLFLVATAFLLPCLVWPWVEATCVAEGFLVVGNLLMLWACFKEFLCDEIGFLLPVGRPRWLTLALLFSSLCCFSMLVFVARCVLVGLKILKFLFWPKPGGAYSSSFRSFTKYSAAAIL
jgi:hypothetical protein